MAIFANIEKKNNNNNNNKKKKKKKKKKHNKEQVSVLGSQCQVHMFDWVSSKP